MDIPERRAILGTQDTGRRQTNQNKNTEQPYPTKTVLFAYRNIQEVAVVVIYASWIHSCLSNQRLSPLQLWDRMPPMVKHTRNNSI